MSGALLGRDTERQIRNNTEEAKRGTSSKIKIFGRNLLLSLIALFSVLSIGAGATAKAAIWDLGDQIVSAVMNICNPNAVPMVQDTQSWVDSALGSTVRTPAAGENNQGNIWSTYNPMVTPSGSNYIITVDSMSPRAPENAGESTRAWLNLLRSQNDGQWLYSDNWSDRSKIDPIESGDWWGAFAGDASVRNAYPVNPSSERAAFFNAPTVALQASYADAPVWVKHPTYTRYGFESLTWTTYGASCYSPEKYATIIPEGLFKALVMIPTLISFGMLRLTLGGELAHIFYMFIYPVTGVIGTFLTPWVALIAIVIGLPYIWLKSKGSIQKLLSGAAWIAAMLFLIGLLSNNARQFTEFAQGIVVKVSGTMACTIAQQAFTSGATTIALSSDAAASEQLVPRYNADGSVMFDAQGRTVYEDMESVTTRAMNDAAAGQGDGDEPTIFLSDLTLADISGTSPQQTTACGSYLDGIYNAFWIGVPLQVWAEGQVGSAQAARDRVAESNDYVGWYQATLNALYVNPNDKIGRAQIQATTRWNDGGYTAQITDDYFNIGKPAQWSLDGHNDEVWEVPVTELDSDSRATPWKTVPFLLNVKFMCKDQQSGTTEKSGLNGADNAGDYDGNKWLYDGTCITGGDAGLINGLTGKNFMDRVALSVVGGVLALIIFLFTVGICVYIGYQKFIWGFMLLFAPIFLGIAAFPNHGQQQFFRKYVEFVIANVVKQIMAVMILVVTVTALGRIVFPNAGSIGDQQFYVPWMLKPFVALMFLLAATLFALPMKRIMVGAVKGDASVVGKTADSIGDAAKVTAGVAAAAGLAVATGGGSALGSAALSGAGRAAQGVAMRKGGMSGALAAAAGDAMSGKAASMNAIADAKAKQMGLMGEDETTRGGLFNMMKRDRAMKKAGSTAGMAERAALAANAKAKNNGEELPYAVGADGKLTKAGKKKALKDFVGARKGNFTKAPEFSALSRNKALNEQRMDAAKAGLLAQFTDADGNVDEQGLNAAAKAQVDAENANMLARQETIGNDLLEADKKKKPEDRKYLDAKGNLTPEGQKKLLSDVRAIDDNNVGMANRALAHQLMSENPDKYNKFVTADNPNGNFLAAMQDANKQNFGEKGIIGDKVVGDKTNIVGLPGSQAYLSTQAPVVGDDLSAAESAMAVQALGGEMKNLSPEAQKAFSNYSEVLANPDSTPEQIKSAHAAALTALHGEKGLSDASKMVNDQVISPVNDRGLNLAPSTIREVADNLPENSVALKQSLENYADKVNEFGADSNEARHALVDVQKAAAHEDQGYYASAVKAMPMPAAALAGTPGFPAATTPLSPSGTPTTPQGTLADATATRVDPARESENYVESMRAHYGLESNPDLKDGQVFTEAERKDIESGKITPVAPASTALAENMNLGAVKNAQGLATASAETLVGDPRELRDAKRAELGLAPDDAPLTAPLVTSDEAAQIREARATAGLAAATGTAESNVAAGIVDPSAASSEYVAQMREYYGLKGNNALVAGAAFTEREAKDIESGKIMPAQLVAAQAAHDAIPTTPEGVRQAKRAELGLAPDSQPATAPLMSAAEQAAVTQMQDLGVQLGGTTPLAPPAAAGANTLAAAASETADKAPTIAAAAVAGTTASTGGTLVEGGVALTPAAEQALATAIDSRGDGSKYVNGMVVNPQTDMAELGKAVDSLPENHAAKGAMENYNKALESRVDSPEGVVAARNEVLSALGVATPVAVAESAKTPEVQQAMSTYAQTLQNPESTPEQIRSAESALYGAAMSAPVAAPTLAPGEATVPTANAPVVAALTPSGEQRLNSMMEQATQAGATPEQVQTLKNEYAAGGMSGLESAAKNAGVAENVVSDWKSAPPEVVAVAGTAGPVLTPAGEARMEAIATQAREAGATPEQVASIQSGYAQGGVAGLEAAAKTAGISENVVNDWTADAPQTAMVSLAPVAPTAPAAAPSTDQVSAPAPTVAAMLTPAGEARMAQIQEQAQQAGMEPAKVEALKTEYATGGVEALERSARDNGIPDSTINEWKADAPAMTLAAATPAVTDQPGSTTPSAPVLTPAGENRMAQIQEQARAAGMEPAQVEALKTEYVTGGVEALETSARSSGIPETVVNEWKTDAPAIELARAAEPVSAPATPAVQPPAQATPILTAAGEARMEAMAAQAREAGVESQRVESFKEEYLRGGMEALETSARSGGISEATINEWKADMPTVQLAPVAPSVETAAPVAPAAPMLTAAGETRMAQIQEQAQQAGVEPQRAASFKEEYLSGGMEALETSARNYGISDDVIGQWKAEAPQLAPVAPMSSTERPAEASALPQATFTPAGEQRMNEMMTEARDAGATPEQVEVMRAGYVQTGMEGLEVTARAVGVSDDVVSNWKSMDAPQVVLSAPAPAAAPTPSADLPSAESGRQESTRVFTASGEQRMAEMMKQAQDSGVPNSKLEQVTNAYREEGVGGLENAARAVGISDNMVNEWKDNLPEFREQAAPAPAAPVAPLSGVIGGQMSGVPERRVEETPRREEMTTLSGAVNDDRGYQDVPAYTDADAPSDYAGTADPVVYGGASGDSTASLDSASRGYRDVPAYTDRDEPGVDYGYDDRDDYRGGGGAPLAPEVDRSESAGDRGYDNRRDDSAPRRAAEDRSYDDRNDDDDYRGGSAPLPPTDGPRPGSGSGGRLADVTREEYAPRRAAEDRDGGRRAENREVPAGDEPTLQGSARKDDANIPEYNEPVRRERENMSIPDDRELGVGRGNSDDYNRSSERRESLRDYAEHGNRDERSDDYTPRRGVEDRRDDDRGGYDDSYRVEPRRAVEDYNDLPRPDYSNYSDYDRDRLSLEDEIGARMLQSQMVENELSNYANMAQRDEDAERRYQELAEQSQRFNREQEALAERLERSTGSMADFDRIERDYLERNIPVVEESRARYVDDAPSSDRGSADWESARERSDKYESSNFIMDSMRSRLSQIKNQDVVDNREVEENAPEQAPEEVVTEGTVVNDENYDEPGKYERENIEAKPQTQRELAVQHTALLRQIKRQASAIKQRDGLMKKRIRQMSRLAEGSPERARLVEQIKGLEIALARLVEDHNRMVEDANRLANVLGYNR